MTFYTYATLIRRRIAFLGACHVVGCNLSAPAQRLDGKSTRCIAGALQCITTLHMDPSSQYPEYQYQLQYEQGSMEILFFVKARIGGENHAFFTLSNKSHSLGNLDQVTTNT